MRNKNSLLLFLLIIALLPYFIICFYALPFADDFCFGWTASQHNSFLEKFLQQYLFWNGRYTADVLVNFEPIIYGKLIIYQGVLFASLLATPIVLFLFIYQVCATKSVDEQPLNWQPAALISLFITLFYCCHIPDITEGTYWFIGICNYHLGNLCFILHLTLLLPSFSTKGRKKALSLAASAMLLVASIGFNEIGAALIPVYYFCALAFNCKLQTANCKLFRAFFFIALISSMFVFLSPGNFTRESTFSQHYHLFHSLCFAGLQTIRFIAIWSFSLPFIILSLIVIAGVPPVKKPAFQNLDYRVIGVLLLFTVFMGSFLPYFATGILGQHRTINYTFFCFILLWIGFLISVSEKFSLRQKLQFFNSGNKTFILAIITVIIIALTGNSRNIWRDFASAGFKSYKTAFMDRQDQELSNPLLPITPLKSIPATFRITDTKADSTWWVDKCMMRFYTETGIQIK